MSKRAITGLTISFFFSACVHAPSSASKSTTITFTAARQGEADACGCTMIDLGGVDREYNALESVRQATGRNVHLTVGTTFAPSPGALEEAPRDIFLRRADLIGEALKKLGTKAVAPSAEDLWLGVDRLRAIEKSSAPFSSANLYSKATGKPIFSAYLDLGEPGRPIYFIGLSAPARSAYSLDADVEVKDAESSLREVIAKLPAGPRLIIVGGSLAEMEWFRILGAVPEVNIAIGPKGENSPFNDAEQFGGSSLFMGVIDGGRELGRLDIDWSGEKVVSFHNPSAVRSYSLARQQWESSVVSLQKRLAKASPASRKELERDLAAANERVRRAIAIVDAPIEGRTEYRSQSLDLSAELMAPQNPLSPWLESYRVIANPTAPTEN